MHYAFNLNKQSMISLEQVTIPPNVFFILFYFSSLTLIENFKLLKDPSLSLSHKMKPFMPLVVASHHVGQWGPTTCCLSPICLSFAKRGGLICPLGIEYGSFTIQPGPPTKGGGKGRMSWASTCSSHSLISLISQFYLHDVLVGALYQVLLFVSLAHTILRPRSLNLLSSLFLSHDLRSPFFFLSRVSLSLTFNLSHS